MAYTRGTKWNEELVISGIFEVIDALKIDHMPTRNEIRGYYKDDRLTNAIKRRKGYYGYAKELGLTIKPSETTMGKKYEKIAFNELISIGYEVEHMPQNFPYDLLIESGVKVDVKASRLYKGEKGSFYSCNLEKPFCTCDLYLVYLLHEGGEIKETLIIPSKHIYNITQLCIGEHNSKYYKYKDKWNYIEQYVEFMKNVS